MKKSGFRYLSLVMALVLCLGVTSSLAESPAMPYMPFQDGNLRVDMSLKVNPGLVAMVAGLTGITDEETMNVINTLVGALNRMRTTMLMGPGGMSAAIGTDEGDLIDIQVSYDLETMDNLLVTSLLPGVALSADPAMVESMIPQQKHPEITPEMIEKVSAPYIEVLNVAYADLFAGQIAEEGAFETALHGSFSSKTPMTLTAHKLAGLLEGMAQVVENDAVLKLHLDRAVAASQTKVPDMGAELRNMAGEIRNQPDITILTGTMYENDAAVYYDAATPDQTGNAMKLDLFVMTPDASNPESSTTVEMRIIAKTASAAQPEDEGPIDWPKVAESIQSGENFSDILITLSTETSTQDQVTSSNTNIKMLVSGLSIGLGAAGSMNMETMENDMQLQVFFMTPEPSLTFNFNTSKTDEEPLAPTVGSSTKIMITGEEMPDETEDLLEASLGAAIPVLLSRLTTALPEEGPALIQMLQDLLTPQPAVDPLGPETNEPSDTTESPEAVTEPVSDPEPVAP